MNGIKGISLLNISYKMVAYIMCEHNWPIPMLFNVGLCQILKNTHEIQADTQIIIIDFKQAWDTPTNYCVEVVGKALIIRLFRQENSSSCSFIIIIDNYLHEIQLGNVDCLDVIERTTTRLKSFI